MPLLFLEFLGTTEMLVIALVALIVFGPRKLPELGRSLGKSIGEFKRASEDFKRTWEREVEVERIERDLHIEQEVKAAIADVPLAAAEQGAAAAAAEQTIARRPLLDADAQTASTAPPAAASPVETHEPAGKQDWL